MNKKNSKIVILLCLLYFSLLFFTIFKGSEIKVNSIQYSRETYMLFAIVLPAIISFFIVGYAHFFVKCELVDKWINIYNVSVLILFPLTMYSIIYLGLSFPKSTIREILAIFLSMFCVQYTLTSLAFINFYNAVFSFFKFNVLESDKFYIFHYLIIVSTFLILIGLPLIFMYFFNTQILLKFILT